MLRTINLHGSLALDGKLQTVELDVDTPQIMFRGLSCLVEGFDSRMRALTTDIQMFIVNPEVTDKNELNSVGPEGLSRTLGDAKELHIIPAVEGGGFEIAAMYFVKGTMAYYVAGFVISLAISYVLGAIAQSMAPKPSTSAGAATIDQKPSFMFNGPVNITEQGYPVPLAYGLKVLTGSTVISVDADTVQI